MSIECLLCGYIDEQEDKQGLSHEGVYALLTVEWICLKNDNNAKHKVIIIAIVSVNNKIALPSNHWSSITHIPQVPPDGQWESMLLEICALIVDGYVARCCTQPGFQTSGRLKCQEILEISPPSFSIYWQVFPWLCYIQSVSTSPSAGPHQPQLGGYCWASGKEQSGFSPQIGGSMWAKV